ncbi:hypothetical protein [Nocardioides rubriscoriae]|uniref:hypothetical protein n=1 Tax=Nocardioides rubriscoriae TaxID=642762 RepID=UPI0011DF6191|nr:hypothetical protein [Nocardioides rubriscoriae]
MLLLGLVLIAVGAVLVIGGVFAAEITGGQAEFMGIDVSPMALFLLGTAAGVCVLLGLSLVRFGARRELRQRKERKSIDELSQKLDRAEAERRRDIDDER